MIVGLAFFTAIMTFDPQAPPWPVMLIMWAFMGLFGAIMVVPSVVAGIGLRKKRPWAKTASIIAGVTASMSAPVGIAVCIYTFWFLFSEPGRLLYDKNRQALPERSPTWDFSSRDVKEHQYVPPPKPPDWR